jgi:hypothetical protein
MPTEESDVPTDTGGDRDERNGERRVPLALFSRALKSVRQQKPPMKSLLDITAEQKADSDKHRANERANDQKKKTTEKKRRKRRRDDGALTQYIPRE